MTVAVIDYGASNLLSVERAFRQLGVPVRRVRRPEQLEQARAIVLPGVGHFAVLMQALERTGLAAGLRAAVEDGAALLGICLGMQALFGTSAEAPTVPGLGWLAGEVERLPASRLPHMGWNRVETIRACPLFDGISTGSWFYFAHSYAPRAEHPSCVAISASGVRFAAAVQQGRLYGVQFHPEKSAEAGLRLLANFLEIAR